MLIINGKFVQLIRNIFFSCENFLRQGENITPLLFSLFINDLNEYLQEHGNTGIEIEYNDGQIFKMLCILVLLFADDTVLLATSLEQLQKCLTDFNPYCKRWQLTVIIKQK